MRRGRNQPTLVAIADSSVFAPTRKERMTRLSKISTSWRGLLACVLLCASPLIGHAQDDARPDPVQRLEVGDAVELNVVGYEDDLNGVYRVADDGSVLIPFVGAVLALGLDRSEVQSRLQERVWAYYINNPDVVVTPLYTINVLGFVREPGPYHIEGGEQVSDLLALAGGAATDARLQRTRITRGGHVIKQNLARSFAIYDRVKD
jgi:protein involved in polysaccharide export with SLBB domain